MSPLYNENIQSNYITPNEFIFQNMIRKERNISRIDIFPSDFAKICFISEDLFISEETKVLNKNSSTNCDFNTEIVQNIIFNLFETLEREKNYFINEGINLPNEKSLNNLELILNNLVKLKIIPSKVSSSVEEGVCLTFVNKDLKLHFEIYNDGDLGYIIENYIKKEIIKNNDVIDIIEAIESIKSFNGYEISEFITS